MENQTQTSADGDKLGWKKAEALISHHGGDLSQLSYRERALHFYTIDMIRRCLGPEYELPRVRKFMKKARKGKYRKKRSRISWSPRKPDRGNLPSQRGIGYALAYYAGMCPDRDFAAEDGWE